MTDIAQIGFKADTNQLADAKMKLDALTPAAGRAEKASLSYSKSVLAAARADAERASKVYAAAKACDNLSRVDKIAAGILAAKTKITLAAANADYKRASAADAAAAAVKKSNAIMAASGGGSGSGGNGNGTGNGAGGSNVKPFSSRGNTNNFVTGNIAAQFQDIGVTAAMGMNPLTIALQQGTQLSAVLSTMESPLKGIAAGFRSIMSATSLLTIGLIGLLAAGLQMVDWTKVAKAVVNGFADAVEVCTPYVLGLAAALSLIYSRTIIVGVATVTLNIVAMGAAAVAAGMRMAAAWFLALGPIGMLIAGLTAAIAAVLLFRDEISKAIGVDVVKIMKDAANKTIGVFVGAYNAIKATWSMLPDVMGDLTIQAANNSIKAIQDLINSSINEINGLIDNLPDWVKGKGNAITYKADFAEFENGFAGAAAKANAVLKKEMNDAMSQDYVGKLGTGIQKFASDAAKKLREYASGIGSEDDKTKAKKDPWEELVKGADRTINTLEAQKNSLYMTSEAAAYLKYQTDLLNEAQQKGIDLTPKQAQKINELAAQMANLEEETKNAKEALDFAKDASKGFVQDMRSGLQEGLSLWESFGNAVGRVLDKITDKLLDEVLDAVFQVGGGGSSSSGGIISGLSSLIGGLFADGAAFNSNGVQKFAKGAGFSNSVVSKPTTFAFAKGGAMGVMGEAGPEAIMPLKRGSDGSLGVQMHGQSNSGGGSGAVVNINIVNNSKAQVSTQTTKNGGGMDIDVTLDEVVANNINRPGSLTNQAMKAQQSRQLIKR